jgi:hypothetical protein
MTEPKDDTAKVDTSKLISPNENSSNEPTPIHDAAKAASQATTDAPETADSFKVDVKRALERETQDGKGDEDPGPSDWISFATEGVEEEAE